MSVSEDMQETLKLLDVISALANTYGHDAGTGFHPQTMIGVICHSFVTFISASSAASA